MTGLQRFKEIDKLMCSCCGVREKSAGLRFLCERCWKMNGDASDPHNQRKGHQKGGKE